MSFLVVDKVLLACSQGTCQTHLKVTALGLLSENFNVELDLEAEAGLGAGLSAGLGGGLDAITNAGAKAEADIEGGVEIKVPDVSLNASLSVPHGMVKKFDAMGNLLSASMYVNGVLEGQRSTYNSAGQVTQNLMFMGGKIHGMASMYANGALMAAMSFKEGLMEGESKFYNAHGQLVLKTHFAANLEDGLRVAFDGATGAVLSEEMFIKGFLKGSGGESSGGRGGFGIEDELEVDLSAASDLDLDMDLTADLAIEALGAIDGHFMATIMDYVAGVNIQPFCLCKSRANPAVAKATKHARGVLRPQPCTPKLESPWIPGSYDITLQDYPALTHSSKLICAYAGIIHAVNSGQKKAIVP